MLTAVEKVLFALLVLVTVAAAYRTFGDMFAIIGRGQGHLNWDAVPGRIWRGLLALFTQGRMYRRRPITAFFHTFVAWAFIYYLLVNVVDIAEAVFTGFRFLPDHPIGDIYRLIADVLTAGALAGIIFLMLRRFVIQPRELSFRDNVKLHPKVPTAIGQDSLLAL